MIRGKSLLSLLLLMVCALAFAAPASAHSVFKKKLAEKYPNKKISCTACHYTKNQLEGMEGIDPADKKPRNAYGKLLQKQFESKTLTADMKSKKGKEKKDFENEVMIPEFEKAYDKVKTMTVHDLIEAGFFEGIDDPEKK